MDIAVDTLFDLHRLSRVGLFRESVEMFRAVRGIGEPNYRLSYL